MVRSTSQKCLGLCRTLRMIFLFSITKTQRPLWETLLRSKIKQAHMEIFKKYKWLFFAIVGNLLLIYADLLTFGKFRISLLTIVFGYTPLFILIVKTVRQNKLHNLTFKMLFQEKLGLFKLLQFSVFVAAVCTTPRSASLHCGVVPPIRQTLGVWSFLNGGRHLKI